MMKMGSLTKTFSVLKENTPTTKLQVSGLHQTKPFFMLANAK